MLNYKKPKSAEKPLTFDKIKEYYLSSSKNDLKFGLEYERLSLDKNSFKNAPYERIEKIIKTFANVKGWGLLYDDKTLIGTMGEGSSISLEPGCQIELSLKPCSAICEIEKHTKEICNLLDRIAKFYDVEFLPAGISPFFTYQNIEILKKKRYEIMAGYLPYFGKFAPVMMRETAGVQLNIDYKSESDAIEKIKMLNFIAPYLTGFFANSPVRNNKITNYKSFRALAWKYTGKNRCNTFYKNLLNNPRANFDDYINAILDVPMLFIERGNEKINITGNIAKISERITFRDFMKFGYGEYSATFNDYILHSSLCFPDIRLKNCIEIRNHDSQNIEMTLALCAFYKGILSAQSDEIMQYFKGHTTDDIENAGFLAAKSGVDFKYKNIDAKTFVKKLFEISYSNLNQDEKRYLNCAFELLNDGRCPADKIIEANVKNAKELVQYLKKGK